MRVLTAFQPSSGISSTAALKRRWRTSFPRSAAVGRGPDERTLWADALGIRPTHYADPRCLSSRYRCRSRLTRAGFLSGHGPQIVLSATDVDERSIARRDVVQNRCAQHLGQPALEALWAPAAPLHQVFVNVRSGQAVNDVRGLRSEERRVGKE